MSESPYWVAHVIGERWRSDDGFGEGSLSLSGHGRWLQREPYSGKDKGIKGTARISF